MNEQGATFRPDFDARAIPSSAMESCWNAPDGAPVRRIDLRPGRDPRGSLLFLPGRGDCYEKYLEALDEWRRAGWFVTSPDWRGQALSGRLGTDATTGHIDDFSVWVDDLGAFWNEWCSATPGPHVLVAHSMGGHIALRSIAEGLVRPDALVLTAPMLGFLPAWAPSPLLHGIARRLTSLGDPRRPAWRFSEKPGLVPRARIELLTHDETRYADEEWWRQQRPGLAMGPASWGWIERGLASIRALEKPGIMESISVPILILATKADRLVSWPAIARAAKRLPHAELLAFGQEARHEILRESDPVRSRAMAAIAELLDRVAGQHET